jgi:site-specific recombinase XerC
MNSHSPARWIDGKMTAAFLKTMARQDKNPFAGFKTSILRKPGSGGQIRTYESARDIQSFRDADESVAAPSKSVFADDSKMTIAAFIEKRFIPDHVAHKKPSGITHYQSMLRHIVAPEEVDGFLKAAAILPGKRLTHRPEWPYLGKVRLCDVQPRHIEELIAAAVKHGYSTQTVTHIRNTINAIFSCAKQLNYLTRDNPAKSVAAPEIVRRRQQSLSLVQVKEMLNAMQYPEKEMAIFALLTPMKMAEVSALQWKLVNLSASPSTVDGCTIPARSVAIRNCWDHGILCGVMACRRQIVAMHQLLLEVLLAIKQRSRFVQPDHFIFATSSGGALNSVDVKSRRLKPLGQQLMIPSLSWQLIHQTRLALLSMYGTAFYDSLIVENPVSSLAGAAERVGGLNAQ